MDTVSQVAADHAELADELSRNGVKYAMGGWIDVLGRSKSKIVPIDHLPQLLAGSERYTPRGMGGIGAMTPHEDECVALPDQATLQVFPWDRRFAWMAADLSYGGREPFALCPRSALKRQLARAADAGYKVNLGVETEFYAFTADSVGATPRPGEPAGYLRPGAASGALRPTPAYDTVSTLDAMPFLDKMADCMTELGFGLFSFDHEGGDGQFEFDFAYDEALVMADRISLFRIMAHAVAQECGLIATFMPKPYTGGWGSGHHYNLSLEDAGSGDNLFRAAAPEDGGAAGWTELTYAFTAGILKHARSIAAVANPTVNSYKRLAARLRDGEISWAPIWASYGDNNRSCLIRLGRQHLPGHGADRGGRPGGHQGEPAPGRADHQPDLRLEVPAGGRDPAAADAARGGRRVHRGPAGARGLRPAVRHRVQRDEVRGVGLLPRRGHRLGADAVPAQPVRTPPPR
jgi:glutamine synthetase